MTLEEIDAILATLPPGPIRKDPQSCRVYWGSHGCMYERGHAGPHECVCRDVPFEDGGVGKPPYYGPDTTFYGEDAA